jgi:hypothetical protein
MTTDMFRLSFVIITQFFPHFLLIIGCVTERVTRRVSHVEQELLTFLEHPSTISVFGGFHIARSLVFRVVLSYAKGVITIRKSRDRLPTLPEYLSSPLVLRRVRVAQSWVFYVLFCRSLFLLFILTVALSCSSAIYWFWVFVSSLVSSNFSWLVCMALKILKNKIKRF